RFATITWSRRLNSSRSLTTWEPKKVEPFSRVGLYVETAAPDGDSFLIGEKHFPQLNLGNKPS
ncbi:MAG: hypothetical protein J6L77_04885, partial [Coprococcus sp.]|nr:hypothetical protein [Coprococcus sp.]